MKLFFLALSLLVSISGYSQKGIITGRLLNSETREPVKNAEIQIANTTIKTYSNFLGYFQLNIDSTENLIVTHIAYMDGLIKVPNQTRFSALLTPRVIKLDTIDLANYPKQTIPFTLPPLDEGKNSNATYKWGWLNFYIHFGNKVIKSKLYKSYNFFTAIGFTIDDKGDLSNITIKPDSLSNSNAIREALSSIQHWVPAFQNGAPETQNFELILSNNNIVELVPEFEGGMYAFYMHIQKNMSYPAYARRMGVEGKVFVQFVVDEEGNITEVKTLRGIGAGCDEEAERIIRLSPKWKPAMQDGKPVKVRMVLPITFKLS